MNCKECHDRIYPYLDRELDPEEVERVREHLDECEGCESALVIETVFLDRVRGSATAGTAPPGVRERLIIRLRADAGGRP